MAIIRNWLHRHSVDRVYPEAAAENLRRESERTSEITQETIDRERRTQTKVKGQRQRVRQAEDAIARLLRATRYGDRQ